MSKFRAGDKVVCISKERPTYFNQSGKMDYMLDRKAVLEVVRVGEKSVLVSGDGFLGVWRLEYKDIEPYRGVVGAVVKSWYIDEDTKQLPQKVVFNYDKKRTTLMFESGEVVRTDTHKTDTYDVWFGFLIGIVKHLSDDKVKYKRFIEQLYSYPKMRRETALEFYVYNLLSDTLSNHQFNKLKGRIKNIKFNSEVIKFKDFELEVITKGLLPF